MNRIFPLVIIFAALTACTTLPTRAATAPSAPGMPKAGMANPASVHCTQQGNKLEIRTAADGSQYGICVFPGGSTCDEWAYFRGECGPATPKTQTPARAVETATQAGSGSPGGGNIPGGNASGGYMPPGTSEKITNWWGTIQSTKPGAQFDDYFERRDLGQIILFGIDSRNPEVQARIKALRDSGKIVHLYGTLYSNVPDYNGSQILVDRIEVME